MDTKPKAYSYIRFSTPEQEKGDSHRPQEKEAEDYAKKYGLTLDAFSGKISERNLYLLFFSY